MSRTPLESLVSFLEYAPDPAVITDAQDRIVVVNHSAESLFGYRRLELIGRPFRELVPSRHPAPARGNAHDEAVVEARHRDGRSLPLRVAFRAVPLDQSLLTAIYFRPAAAWPSTGESAAFEQLPTPVFRLTRAGVVEQANEASRQLLGLVARGGTQPLLARFLTIAERAVWQSILDEVFAVGEPRVTELWLSLPDEGNCCLEFQIVPDKPAGREIETVLVIGQDITRHRHVEQALEASELRFRQLAEGSHDLISQHAMDTSFTYASPASVRLLGLPPTELLARPLLDLVHVEDRDRLRGAIASVEEGGVPSVTTYRVQHASGHYVWWETSIQLADAAERAEAGDGSDGRGGSIICISRDITERMRGEEILRTASRMEATATLAAGVAHDFNNLMTGILGNAELLLEDPAFRAAASRLSQVADAAKRGGALAQQLLAYARGGKYKTEAIDLNQVVHQTLHLQRHATPPRIQLQEDLDPNLPAIEADPVQIGQVLTNLCINACEAIPNSGLVKIRTRKLELTPADVTNRPGLVAGPAVLLQVVDTGLGMDPPTQARIFEPFFSTKFQGRGLGLAAAYGIVKNHRGFIGVESTPGRGTCFSIYFPASAATPQAPVPVTESYPTGTETILLVDDDESVVSVTQSILEKLHYTVVVARHGVEAVEIARTYAGELHLALLDMGMPQAGGAEAFPFLRATRPEMRILISSGYEMNEVVQELLAAGASAFLQKPYRVSTLAQQVRAVLDAKVPNVVPTPAGAECGS